MIEFKHLLISLLLGALTFFIAGFFFFIAWWESVSDKLSFEMNRDFWAVPIVAGVLGFAMFIVDYIGHRG